ncbi:MAG: hypothetical protein A2X94_07830 [Bdellovibrionales bacterium GWB1_55_8]|nr:MAG: hypothetical protein A2X94_07830 [Bdellovibrionales bacterium GWB1_55_8]
MAAIAVCLNSASLIQADPTDDFSFTLAHPPETEVYRLLPEHRVVDVLWDRLDLFPKSQMQSLARHILDLCRKYRFDPVFILSLIEVESAFRVKAVSPMGALGLMQVMPATADWITRGWKVKPTSARAIMDPFMNISIGIAYLAFLRDRYSGLSPYYLVAAYNAGHGKIDEILLRKDFRPVQTKKYFEDIRRRVPMMRFYRSQSNGRNAVRQVNRTSKPQLISGDARRFVVVRSKKGV